MKYYDNSPLPTRLSWLSIRLALALWTAFLAGGGWVAKETVAQNIPIELEKLDSGQIEVRAGGKLLTRIDHRNFGKPVLYPLMSPGQTRLSRNWPMDDSSPEERDHPHHKGLWYGHGAANGVDFWADKGRIDTLGVAIIPDRQAVVLENEWRAGDRVVCTDRIEYRFGAAQGVHWIEVDLTIRATHGELLLGDTKEGFVAVRTHPHLRLTANPAQGVPEVFGRASNSAGDEGKSIWGKRARWVFYRGTVEGNPVGIAILDHPGNAAEPTTWHARDYGLIAANPFGLHEFLGMPRDSGQLRLDEGQSQRWRYRFALLDDRLQPPSVEELFEQFAAEGK